MTFFNLSWMNRCLVTSNAHKNLNGYRRAHQDRQFELLATIKNDVAINQCQPLFIVFCFFLHEDLQINVLNFLKTSRLKFISKEAINQRTLSISIKRYQLLQMA